ncbi:MAG: glycosyltransferase [Candidatus Thorarchaeota archaeon]
MTRKIILITFTGEHASGGVPRWVRDFKAGFPEAISYSWQDVLDAGNRDAPMPESDRAQVLSAWLKWGKKVNDDDIIIVDGFWGKGWEEHENVVSVCHGIWSHLIKEEADAGDPPDNPFNHKVQVNYRRDHLKRGGRLVAVSEFIQHQMDIQWGFKSTVINNAIDLNRFVPSGGETHGRSKKLIIHGVNDRGNENKGWSHIRHVQTELISSCDVWSLDEAHNNMWTNPEMEDKYKTLSLADLVLIPSGYEGNSYFALETMACGVPVIAYNVGLFYELKKNFEGSQRFIGVWGVVMDRLKRSKEFTLEAVKRFLSFDDNWEGYIPPREIASEFSIQKFHRNWRHYLKHEFGYEQTSHDRTLQTLRQDDEV